MLTLSLLGNGSLPCTNCLDRGEKCVMGTKKARGQGHKAALGGYDPTDLVRQIEELKAMIESKADDAMTTPTPTTRPAGFQGFDHHGGTATNCLPTRPPPASLTSPSPAADQDIGARILSGSDFASSSVSFPARSRCRRVINIPSFLPAFFSAQTVRPYPSAADNVKGSRYPPPAIDRLARSRCLIFKTWSLSRNVQVLGLGLELELPPLLLRHISYQKPKSTAIAR